MVDIARLRHADDGMDEQVSSLFLRGTERKLVMRTVHRIAGLEGDDLRPASLAEFFTKLLRRAAERLVIVVDRELQALDGAADVDRLTLVHQIVDGWVRGVFCAEDLLGF